MKISETLVQLRKERGLTQLEVAGYLSKRVGKTCAASSISHWEKGVAMPTIDLFLALCELYGVSDVMATFCGHEQQGHRFRGTDKLNTLGISRIEEYITMLCGNSIFADTDSGHDRLEKVSRIIKLYDIPAAAGTGSFLDSYSYTELEVDETVPKETDFAIKISGDSMTPRFVDGQIVFIKEQQTLEIGEIGIFGLNGDSYIKKLGHGELISLNPKYDPIKIDEYSSFYTFGKVVG